MSKVDCKDCQFYHNGRCEELGEYTTPGECECSWFAPKAIKKTCVAEIAKNAKQTPAEIAAMQYPRKRGGR